jgi:hypothetical protein
MPSLEQQREVVIAFLALERYLPSGEVGATEIQEAMNALRRSYTGPSDATLQRFKSITSLADAGEWLATMRMALEREITPEIWAEVTSRELQSGQSEEPPERMPPDTATE